MVKFSLKQLASYLSMVKNDPGDYSFRLNNEAKWKARWGAESGYGLELKFDHSFKLMLENSWFVTMFSIQVLWLRHKKKMKMKLTDDVFLLCHFWEVYAYLRLPINNWKDTTLISARWIYVNLQAVNL